jgi:heterodisulfide reductase subunit C
MSVGPIRIDIGSPELMGRMKALGAGDVLKCYQCGTCVGDCPATYSGLHVRKLMKYSIYGLEDLLLDDPAVWGCTTCHQCSERCPEGASPFDLVQAVRRFQGRQGKLPKELMGIIDNLLEYGHSVSIEDKHRKARLKVGLPEIPPTIAEFPDMLKELRTIVEFRGVNKILEQGGGDE